MAIMGNKIGKSNKKRMEPKMISTERLIKRLKMLSSLLFITGVKGITNSDSG
jgi:hypothetical protein